MRLYSVIFILSNNQTSQLRMFGKDNTIAKQVKELLQDIEAGECALVEGENFSAIVEA